MILLFIIIVCLFIVIMCMSSKRSRRFRENISFNGKGKGGRRINKRAMDEYRQFRKDVEKHGNKSAKCSGCG